MNQVSAQIHDRMMGAIKAQQDAENEEEVTKPVQTSALAKVPAKKEADKSKKPTPEEQQRAMLKVQQQLLEIERKEVEKIKLEAYKIQALNEVGLTMEYAQFINGADEYEIGRNAREFRLLLDKTTEREVAKRVMQRLNPNSYGTYDNASSSAPRVTAVTYSNNPFAKETFNMTAQAKLFRENPIEARRLAAAAGAKLNW